MQGKIRWLLLALLMAASLAALWSRGMLGMLQAPDTPLPSRTPSASRTPSGPLPEGLELATFGGGCFWCTEAFFQKLRGVHAVASGYSGGTAPNPTYRQVCSGATGHAEVIQVHYDPATIAYRDLLEVFWKTHDPTTRNRQGDDIGTQYRSVVFYHTPRQRELAEQYRHKLDLSGAFPAPIVTAIAPFAAFYPAEEDHQHFYEDNPRHPYCRLIIHPKLDKFEQVFKDKLRSAP